MEAFAFAVHSFEIVSGWDWKKEVVWNMMIMGMKVRRIVIGSLRLSVYAYYRLFMLRGIE